MNRKKLFRLVMCGAMFLASASVFTACKDYDDDINDLQSQVDALNKELSTKYSALQSGLDAANAAITKAQADIVKAQSAADAAQGDATLALTNAAAAMSVAQTNKTAIETAMGLIADLQANKVDQSVYDAKMTEIDATLETVTGQLKTINGAIEGINTQLAALEAFQAEMEALKLEETLAGLQTQIDAAVEALETAKAELQAQIDTNATDIEALQKDLGDLGTLVDSINTNLNTLFSSRLTSLVHCPSLYVEGIQTLEAFTIQYQPWRANGTQCPTDTTVVTVPPTALTDYYFANPTSVKAESIESINVLFETAESRADAVATPLLSVADGAYSITDGKLAVNFTYTPEADEAATRAGNSTTLTMFAIQAQIPGTSVDANPVFVTSDFVSLEQGVITPQIYNLTSNPVVGASSFYYPSSDATTANIAIAQVAYTSSLDLTTIAGVASLTGNILEDYANYGLTLSFDTVNYTTGTGTSAVNQTAGSKVTGTTIALVEPAASSVGLKPMVKATLTAANGDIVDIAYFLIQWTSPAPTTPLAFEFNVDYNPLGVNKCDTTFTDSISAADLASIYAAVGLDQATFNNVYTTMVNGSSVTTPLAGIQAQGLLKNLTVPTDADSLGYITYINYNATTKTNYLQYALSMANAEPTQAEYIATVATRTAYGAFVSLLDGTKLPFSVTFNIKLPSILFGGEYNDTYWTGVASSTNASKYGTINGTVWDDAIYGHNQYTATQFIANLMKGYVPSSASVSSLVANGDTAQFVFDAATIAEEFGAFWTVSDDGKTLSYYTEKDNKGKPTGTPVPAAYIGKGGNAELADSLLILATATGANIATGSAPITVESPTAGAQALLALGQNIPVNLVAQYGGKCTTSMNAISATIDQFGISMIQPVTMTTTVPTNASFSDKQQLGDTIKVASLVTLTGWGDTGVILNQGKATTSTANLAQWFGVTSVVWDLANATTNLTINAGGGIVAPTASTDYSTWTTKWSDVAAKGIYTLKTVAGTIPAGTGSIATTESVVFINNGTQIAKSFQVAIPVYAVTLWNTQLYDVNQPSVVFTIAPPATVGN